MFFAQAVRSARRQGLRLYSQEVPGFRKPGAIPTDYELASGSERFEYLKRLEGQDPWKDLHPITLTSKPTVKNPYVIRGIDAERYIGCTGSPSNQGYPANSHEPVYLTIRPGDLDKCPHCGNVFKYELEH